MTDVIWVESAESFLEHLHSNDEVVVDFTAPGWCRPCQQFAPHFDKAASTNSERTYIAVDVDKAPWAMSEYGVQSVPTVKHFRAGDYVGDLKSRTVLALLNELN